MVVGICRLELHLAENHSLKGKRQIVKSVCARLRNEFNLAAAEVDANDVWQTAVLGLSCVSNNGRHASQILERAVHFVQNMRMDADLADYTIEILYPF